MTPREIIARAWAITGHETSLRRWGFTSSFLETLLNVKLVMYQTYFFYEYFMSGGTPGFFDVEVALYHVLPFWFFLTIVITFLVMVVIEFFMPHLCLGAIIGLAAKAYRGEEVKGGLVLGVYNFFPIFAVREIFFLARTTTTITAISLILRYIDHPLKAPSVITLILLWAVSNILRFLTSFAEEAIVIRKSHIFSAMGRSFKLFLSHLGHLMFLVLLMLVISIRVIINAIIVLLIPALVLGLGLLLATFLSMTLSVVLATITGFGLIVGASYFFAYLHVFKQTVWTITYLELSKHKDIDLIVADEGGGGGHH
ncbi:MAG: Uncharacterized protein G01um101425_988 [Candidatus Peregrinibacteria bacterium Gr01-1014_25]|nr:MAG: Uncharacterized protein G01um101425_988 [Candidatus Peregrinibacteria bacterium Gr01-1014_25]